MLSGGCLIIVLVDKRKLDPWLGAGEPGSGGMGGMSMSMCLPAVLCGMELGYAGHYVLLVGFDAGTQVRCRVWHRGVHAWGAHFYARRACSKSWSTSTLL